MHFRSRAQQRWFCVRILLGSAAIFAGSFLLGNFSTALSSSSESSSFLRDQHSRLLRFSRGILDPKSTAPRPKTVIVYVTSESYQTTLDGRDEYIFNPALSIFKTDALRRYGTGRVQYIVREHAECNPACKVDGAALQQEPCLAVTRHVNKDQQCDLERLRCNYPMCKTMVTNDELCVADDSFDARQYFTSDRPDGAYLPLGPRLHSWRSLTEVARLKNPQFFVLPSSKRRFAFNALFSQRTNHIRQALASLIERRGPTSRLPVYASMTDRDLEDERHNQLKPDDYVEVLLDSIFTLSPAGHNPECYRIFEAAEAGSIPVFLRDDLTGARHPNPQNRKELRDAAHPCKNALADWRDAPAVVLDSWDDLYPTIEKMMEDPAALDRMQDELAKWYDEYMRGAVSRFEDFVLDDTTSAAPGEGHADEPREGSVENAPPPALPDGTTPPAPGEVPADGPPGDPIEDAPHPARQLSPKQVRRREEAIARRARFVHD